MLKGCSVHNFVKREYVFEDYELLAIHAQFTILWLKQMATFDSWCSSGSCLWFVFADFWTLV